MSYATVNDMRLRYSANDLDYLANTKINYDSNNQPLQTADDIISAALVDASVVIDGYIDSRVTLPLTAPPAVLVRAACIIAYHNLQDKAVTDKASRDYDGVIKFLERIASGDVSLGLSADKKRPETNDIAIIESAGSVWARNRSKGFI